MHRLDPCEGLAMTSAAPSSMPADEAEPLTAYRAIRTSEVGEAESRGGLLLSPHRLVPADEAAFQARVHVARLPAVALFYLRYGTELTVDVPQVDGYVAVTVPLTGGMQIDHGGERVVATAQRSSAVISPGDDIRMRWSESFSMLCLRIDVRAVRESLRRLTGDECRRPLRFGSAVADGRAADAIYGIARLLQSAFETAGTAECLPGLLGRQLQEQVLTTFLTSRPHNYTELIFRSAANPSRRYVREAIDLIESEHVADLTVGSLAQLVGVSVRALEQGFRRDVEKAPHQYLHDVRLMRAHDELCRSSPGETSVTQVALRWGFGHQGRFAAYYRARFGRSPSHTLRHG